MTSRRRLPVMRTWLGQQPLSQVGSRRSWDSAPTGPARAGWLNDARQQAAAPAAAGAPRSPVSNEPLDLRPRSRGPPRRLFSARPRQQFGPSVAPLFADLDQFSGQPARSTASELDHPRHGFAAHPVGERPTGPPTKRATAGQITQRGRRNTSGGVDGFEIMRVSPFSDSLTHCQSKEAGFLQGAGETMSCTPSTSPLPGIDHLPNSRKMESWSGASR